MYFFLVAQTLIGVKHLPAAVKIGIGHALIAKAAGQQFVADKAAGAGKNVVVPLAAQAGKGVEAQWDPFAPLQGHALFVQ